MKKSVRRAPASLRAPQLAAVVGGAGSAGTEIEPTVEVTEKTKHDTVKNSISNVR